MFRCNEVLVNKSTLSLTQDYVSEGRLPEMMNESHDCPYRILGKVRGCGFMGDYRSDNGRWYPSKLWENTCNAEYVKEMLNDKTMFGTCGHPNTPGDEHPIIVDYLTDWEIGKGTNSHIVADLDYTNSPTGIIEYWILNTDWGKNLYAHLAAGSKLAVSSRAMADFIPGEYHNGDPVMDPDNYMLDTFDVVRCPGINVAKPNCIEYKESLDNKIKTAENKKSKIIVSNFIEKRNDFKDLIF